MKRIMIILWTGSVMLGACSMLRQSEQEQAASATLAAVETQSAIRHDSLVTRAGRVVRIARRGAVTSPYTGEVHRYRERIHIDERGQTTHRRSASDSTSTRHQVSAQRYETSHVERHVASQPMGWWWLFIVGTVVVFCLRLFRFWPFK